METVISWDIGLKNLSYCILGNNSEDEPLTKHNFSVIDWDLIDLYPEDKEEVFKCIGLTKKKTVCGKKASYICKDEYYCKTHSLKDRKEIKKKKKIKRKPFEYALRIKNELDKRPELHKVNTVLIENQPALMNPIMKTVQMIIFSYFSFKHSEENPIIVKNINAKMKEKLPDKDLEWKESKYCKHYLERIEKVKNKYSRRKLLCLEYAKLCLETAPGLQDFLETHKKQDDLTDSFLMSTDWLLRK